MVNTVIEKLEEFSSTLADEANMGMAERPLL